MNDRWSLGTLELRLRFTVPFRKAVTREPLFNGTERIHKGSADLDQLSTIALLSDTWEPGSNL
jgi:hypothetical protein